MLTASALNSSEYRRRVFLVMNTSNASSMRLTGVSAPIRPVHPGRRPARALREPAHGSAPASAAGGGRARPGRFRHRDARCAAQAAPGVLRPAAGQASERAQDEALGQAGATARTGGAIGGGGEAYPDLLPVHRDAHADR